MTPLPTAAGALLLLLPAVAAALPQSDALRWSPCEDEPTAECATLVQPFDHETPDGEAIELALRRIRGGDEGDAPVRLWYVAGGPGDAATTALGRLREVFPDPGLDLYAIDHRGTGGSARLGCPEQEAEDSPEGPEIAAGEWPACIEWIRERRDDLGGLTTSASARDLAAALEATASPGTRTVVLGVSYGTYLVNRYLLFSPEQPDAVILDGLVPPDWTMDEIDRGLADFGRRLLALCVDDAACRGHLGERPLEVAGSLGDRFDEGHCSDLGVDGDTIRLLLGNLAMGGPSIWPYIPAMVHRLDQCRLRDLLAVGALVENLFESGAIAEDPAAHSPVLQRHVALSEMWPVPPPRLEDLELVTREASMTTAIGPSFGRTFEAWPRYERPPEIGRFADYEGPALLLHGGLDPTMPARRLEPMLERYDGPAQSFVLFPTRGHVVLNENPCAREIYGAFLDDPTRAPSTECVASAEIDPLALPADADSALGTGDLWGDSLSDLERQAIFFGTIALAIFGYTVWFLWRRRRARRARS